MLDIDLAEASRSDKLPTRCPTTRSSTPRARRSARKRYRLVEAAAGAVADAVLDAFPAGRARVRVTVHKPHAPIAATFDDVGVVDPARKTAVAWLRR